MKTTSTPMRTLVLSGNPHNSNLATRAHARSAPFLRRAFPNLLQLLQAGDQPRSCSCCGTGAELSFRSLVLGGRNIICVRTRAGVDDTRISSPHAHERVFRSLRRVGMQNGSQTRHPASNYGLHMAESHQHVPGDSSGSGENLGEVLRLEIVIEMNEVWWWGLFLWFLIHLGQCKRNVLWIQD